MDRATIAYADKVCLRIAKSLVEEGLSTEKIKRITGFEALLVLNIIMSFLSQNPPRQKIEVNQFL